MAKKDRRSPEQVIKSLEAELADKERELLAFREELNQINNQLERFIGQVSSEIKMATLIQRSLVPTDIPTIKGFAFSTKFVSSPISGGDYFDIFELEDKMRFGVLLANSSGHGMASLFLSVLLKLTTQIEAKKGMEPDEVLKRMSKEIQANMKGSEFANVFYSIADRRTFVLTYAKAGSVPAFLYKASDDKLVKLDPTGPPIGREPKGHFKIESIHLEPGDKIILTSEGLIKARRADGEVFGEGRLFETILKNPSVPPHELRNEILFQVTRFVEGEEYPQDISVLVCEVKDRVIKLRKG